LNKNSPCEVRTLPSMKTWKKRNSNSFLGPRPEHAPLNQPFCDPCVRARKRGEEGGVEKAKIAARY
jgi:hypothetical protein